MQVEGPDLGKRRRHPAPQLAEARRGEHGVGEHQRRDAGPVPAHDPLGEGQEAHRIALEPAHATLPRRPPGRREAAGPSRSRPAAGERRVAEHHGDRARRGSERRRSGEGVGLTEDPGPAAPRRQTMGGEEPPHREPAQGHGLGQQLDPQRVRQEMIPEECGAAVLAVPEPVRRERHPPGRQEEIGRPGRRVEETDAGARQPGRQAETFLQEMVDGAHHKTGQRRRRGMDSPPPGEVRVGPTHRCRRFLGEVPGGRLRRRHRGAPGTGTAPATAPARPPGGTSARRT